MTLPSGYRSPNSRYYREELEDSLSDPAMQGFFIIAILAFLFLGYIESLEPVPSHDNGLYYSQLGRSIDYLTSISGFPSSTIWFSMALVAFALLIFPLVSSRI